ncbi:pectin acetylesterase-family hydrolase [Parvibaculum sp.]|jgi:hypothetical protein|uniref:pectin acetylesterase-family hydrolase n=1 Tax=Parvibaculum sp. TaxID=2024848 RepID=UPI003C71CA3C
MRFFTALAAIAISLAFTGTQAGAAEGSWTTIEPGGETSCATGTPYSFHVKPGDGADAEKLLLFLNGGGACWAGDLCIPESEPSAYVPYADVPPNDPRGQKGVFDLTNPENPVSSWTHVYASYCTGDVHIGNRDVTYKTSGGTDLTIRHRGRTNVEAVLAWVYDNVKTPKRIIVAGSSAGAIAAPLYAAEVAHHYPSAEVIALADGAGGYRDEKVSGLIENWGFWDGAPEWTTAIPRESATFEDIDRAAAAHAPNMRFTEFDTAYDSVQEMFLRLLGNEAPLYPLLQKNRDELADAIPGFQSYTARGTAHTLLRYPWFYTFEEEGVRTVDWFRALANGENVESVSCREPEICALPGE